MYPLHTEECCAPSQVVNGPSHPGATGPPPARATPPPPQVWVEGSAGTLESELGRHIMRQQSTVTTPPPKGWRDELVAHGPSGWAAAVRAHTGLLLTDTTW